MERTTELADRLTEVLLNGHWIANTNYKSQIENLTWEQARQKTGTFNSIAALTFHVNYYLAGMMNVFKGGELEIRDKYSFDMPVITSERDWQRLVDEFLTNAEAFVDCVLQLPENKLEEAFADEKYGTYARNIEGLIEHSYYHLGQISLLKKMLDMDL
jgi:uncharacterized damage-inducible protein DinB